MQPQHQQQRYTRDDRGGPRCWNCGNLGHVASNCRRGGGNGPNYRNFPMRQNQLIAPPQISAIPAPPINQEQANNREQQLKPIVEELELISEAERNQAIDT